MRYKPENVLPLLTIDCAIFGFDGEEIRILLVKRDIEPERGLWQMPGGWMRENEDTDAAARRLLFEATGVDNIYMKQLQVFSRVDRFPLERILTLAYKALIKPQKYHLKPGPDTSDARWFKLSDMPKLAFDHGDIFNAALEDLRTSVRLAPVGFELLPKKFTLNQIKMLYEAILQTELDKSNFRKKMLKMGLLKELEEFQKDVPHRAARLYSFDEDNYLKLLKQGFSFGI